MVVVMDPMDPIDTLESFIKGAARGGKYFRREPTGNPKRPWRYYYTKEEYERAHRRQVSALVLTKRALLEKLKSGTYSVISAGRNPAHPIEGKLPADHPMFAARHEKLRTTLEQKGMRYTEVEGHYGGSEKSFMVYHQDDAPRRSHGRSMMVHHDSPSEFAVIRAIGKQLNQDSVIHSHAGVHEMHFTVGEHAGEFIRGKGHEVLPTADDFFTEAPTKRGVTKFSLGFDFDHFHPSERALYKSEAVMDDKDPIDALADIAVKRDARGGKYYKRVPKADGGYRYFYTKADYEKHMRSQGQEPHVDGSRAAQERALKKLNSDGLLVKSGGPFLGPHGGLWQDAAHTIPFKRSDMVAHHERRLSSHDERQQQNAAAEHAAKPWYKKFGKKKQDTASNFAGVAGDQRRADIEADVSLHKRAIAKHGDHQLKVGHEDPKHHLHPTEIIGLVKHKVRKSEAVMDDRDPIDALGDLLQKGVSAEKPPAGFQAVTGSKKGGFKKQVGGKWVYWYPGGSTDIKKYNIRVTQEHGTAKRGESHAEIAKKLEAGIDKAADLCKINPSTCQGNLGIERKDMPQFDTDSHPNVIKDYLESFKKDGVKVTETRKRVGDLKATQKEIQAQKAYGMADAYYKNKKGEIAWSPNKGAVVVSKDGYVLDGHHRWAATVIADPSETMPVYVVDAPIKDLLARSEQFYREGKGVKKAGLTAPSIGVKKNEGAAEVQKSWTRVLIAVEEGLRKSGYVEQPAQVYAGQETPHETMQKASQEAFQLSRRGGNILFADDRGDPFEAFQKSISRTMQQQARIYDEQPIHSVRQDETVEVGRKAAELSVTGKSRHI